jgi:predicted ester cyclase
MPDGTELAATGRHVSVPFVTLFGVKENKISSHGAYWDVATVMAQLGLMPSAE